MPRVRDGFQGLSRRKPYLDDTYSSHTILCYCKECDQEIERNLPLRLSEFCDCDQYTRWICMKCKIEEDEPNHVYYRTRTKGEYVYPTIGDDGVRDDGMWLTDHQEDRAVSLLNERCAPTAKYLANLCASFGVHVGKGPQAMGISDVHGVSEGTMQLKIPL
jgi:hypothetical protein